MMHKRKCYKGSILAVEELNCASDTDSEDGIPVIKLLKLSKSKEEKYEYKSIYQQDM